MQQTEHRLIQTLKRIDHIPMSMANIPMRSKAATHLLRKTKKITQESMRNRS